MSELAATTTEAAQPYFAADELRRVGIAAAIAVVSPIAIVLALMPIVGYNGLAHCGPRAVVSGATIGLLIGDRGRWRALALLGVVLGLFFGFIQPGIAPLAIIFAGQDALPPQTSDIKNLRDKDASPSKNRRWLDNHFPLSPTHSSASSKNLFASGLENTPLSSPWPSTV